MYGENQLYFQPQRVNKLNFNVQITFCLKSVNLNFLNLSWYVSLILPFWSACGCKKDIIWFANYTFITYKTLTTTKFCKIVLSSKLYCCCVHVYLCGKRCNIFVPCWRRKSAQRHTKRPEKAWCCNLKPPCLWGAAGLLMIDPYCCWGEIWLKCSLDIGPLEVTLWAFWFHRLPVLPLFLTKLQIYCYYYLFTCYISCLQHS